MEKLSNRSIIISCEHAANTVPPEYAVLFKGSDTILNSHRGWDPGALNLAKKISKELNAPLFSYPYTRLLIEPNRSPGHPKLFSEFSKTLSQTEKRSLLDTFYFPYRNRVKHEVQKLIQEGKQVLHLSVHSFSPELKPERRNFEIGILYDPKRTAERFFSQNWKHTLRFCLPDFRVRMNRPYKGASDGFTTAMRKKFEETHYLGIELEVNQNSVGTKKLPKLLAKSIHETISQ